MAYGASLESWLGASPRGFESPILRQQIHLDEASQTVSLSHETSEHEV